MIKRLTKGIGFGIVILMLGCTHLYDLSTDTQKREAVFAENPSLREATTGMVFRVKQDLILFPNSAPGRYSAVDHGTSSDPQSKEDYYASPRKWPGVAGYIEAGTKIRGVRLERFEAIECPGWTGIVYEILNGPHSGKLLAPTAPLFSIWNPLRPNPEFLEEVPAVKDIKQQESSK